MHGNTSFFTFLIAQIQALFCGFIDLKRGQPGLPYLCPFLINSYRPGNYKVNPSHPAWLNGGSVPECPAESALSLSAARAAPSKLGNLPFTGLGNLAIPLFSIKSQIFFRNSSATKPALPVPRPGRDREAREYMNIILVRKDYSVRRSKPNPCMPARPGATSQEHYHAL